MAQIDSINVDSMVPDSVMADSVMTDSISTDSITYDTLYYLLLDPPASPDIEVNTPPSALTEGMSWFMSGVILLFVIIAIRYRKNSKYFSAIFRDAVEVRERGNVFDETVREKSFIILLNILWCVCVGILLYEFIRFEYPPGEWATPALTVILVGIWQVLMIMAYNVIGYVFSDRVHTTMWVNGYMAVCGLSTLLLFPPALLIIYYPAYVPQLLLFALAAFIAAKLMFIWKGFRIFFKDITSWVLFLYYLCSLEIVPLILLYVVARIADTSTILCIPAL